MPDDFNQDLYLWLQRRLAASSDAAVSAPLRHLTWLHQLRLQEYDAAAGTLQDVTNTQEVTAALAWSKQFVLRVTPWLQQHTATPSDQAMSAAPCPA